MIPAVIWPKSYVILALLSKAYEFDTSRSPSVGPIFVILPTEEKTVVGQTIRLSGDQLYEEDEVRARTPCMMPKPMVLVIAKKSPCSMVRDLFAGTQPWLEVFISPSSLAPVNCGVARVCGVPKYVVLLWRRIRTELDFSCREYRKGML